ncbi:MAG: 30S ribosomal protein S17 [Candidatus Omnitrophica bacterium CG11_big_fil_rev_8_21_14_0_20_45_26]|uniref:Small ribosomal subunit protein uS17 n=1 Tax=Candidatus Abzuiibacterium crystallinum TaxID=1974748 RepID=A0A2H0LN78_9BACT|nr:MAG: 30S ribosomal protein S17 [Candidatus Omnitrophica bacterium CG11_big_fil_rev_8_21_14_0_20_45_26]PIW65100.1 MAG: 30S ribosomal protein S17 [Candidatus Omnitrophica bacterium CG12_big_fil_rev_8_21_14_0_65_45_16]
MANTEKHSTRERGIRREKVGQVIRAKAAKTIVVEIERLTQHPLYRKVIRKRRRFLVHDEKSAAKLGDKVRIVESKPISKLKSWQLVEVLKH